VVEEAHALGVPVAAATTHCRPSSRQRRRGVDGIEHCSCLTLPGSGCSTACWRRWPPPDRGLPTLEGRRVRLPARPSPRSWRAHRHPPRGVVELVAARRGACFGDLDGGAGLRAEGPQGPAAGGYDANLLLVDGDPLEDIGALRRVSGVVLRGAMIDIRGVRTCA
jgi:hypothetical protein